VQGLRAADVTRAILTAILCTVLCAAAGPLGELRRAEYVRCVDGDTIVVLVDRVETRVRLTGVQCPDLESGSAAAFSAAAYTAAQCEGAWALWLEIDPAMPEDRYGRMLAWCWVDAGESAAAADLVNLNVALVESGHANIYDAPEAARYFEEVR
jgi:endonuclease YncB( thermonuclease family)